MAVILDTKVESSDRGDPMARLERMSVLLWDTDGLSTYILSGWVCCAIVNVEYILKFT